MHATALRTCVGQPEAWQESTTDACRVTDEPSPASAEPIRFIAHPDFNDPARVGLILENACRDDSVSSDRESGDSSGATSKPPRDGQFAAAILTREQERTLFMRMNCLKALAEKYRRRAARDLSPAACLRKMSSLLECANEARSQLAAANQRLVRSIARSFANNSDSRDELFCEGNLVLLKAIDSFDASRGFRFSTYATHSVRRHLARAVSRQVRQTQRVQAVEHVEPAIENDATDRIDAESLAVVHHMLNSCTPQVREILVRRFGLDGSSEPMKYHEIAPTFGLSAERIRQIVIRNLENLREEFGERLGIGA